MKGHQLLGALVLLCAVTSAYGAPTTPAPVPAGYTMGTVVNGDFESGLNGWTVTPVAGLNTSDIVSIGGNSCLSLSSEADNSCNWSQIQVYSLDATVPYGATHTTFTAYWERDIGTQTNDGAYWGTMFAEPPPTTMWYGGVSGQAAPHSWTEYRAELAPEYWGKPLRISISTEAWSGEPSPDNYASGQLWIDNIGFIPEPATLSLLALGGLAMIRRRR